MRVDLRPTLHSLGVGPEVRVPVQIVAADDAEQPLGHGLGGRRDGDPTAVAGGVDVARRGALGGAAHALADLARELVDGGLGTEDREDRLQQADVDHLTAAAVDLDVAHRDDGGHGAGEPGDHVGHGQGRQDRLAIVEAVARGEARHGLDQRAEARPLGVGSRLPEPRDPHDDQLGIALVQLIGADAELLEIAIAEALDQHVEVRGEVEDDPGRLRRFQVERDALLVPRVHLPVHADARPPASRAACRRCRAIPLSRPRRRSRRAAGSACCRRPAGRNRARGRRAGGPRGQARTVAWEWASASPRASVLRRTRIAP